MKAPIGVRLTRKSRASEASVRAAGIRLLEAHVQQACVELLQFDGWRAFRTELTVQRERGRVVGERGQPDYLFIRYCAHLAATQAVIGDAYDLRAQAEVMWVEFKRPGEKPRADQLAWHEAERQRGALVLVCDDIDAFRQMYKASGLARRF